MLAGHNKMVADATLVADALFGDEPATDSSENPQLQFIEQKSALADKCKKAILEIIGNGVHPSIIKRVEVADSKLPKDPAPAFVVPTAVECVLLV